MARLTITPSPYWRRFDPREKNPQTTNASPPAPRAHVLLKSVSAIAFQRRSHFPNPVPNRLVYTGAR